MVVSTLHGIGEEFVGLLGRTSAAWWRSAPWLLGLCLMSWAGYYAAVLLGTELAFRWPWLVILALAISTVVQLAAIVIALRHVMERQGVDLDAEQAIPGLAPGRPVRLVARTILPFLAIYAAFGFVDDYARNVFFALAGRYGLGAIEFMVQLDPTRSPTAFAVVSGVAIGLYLARRGLDRLAGRSERAWIGLVGAVLEASWVLLLFLSLFRVVEQAQLWLNGRQLAAWWDGLQDTLFGWIQLTGAWLDAWNFLADHAWPAFWDVLTQPLAWLALAAVVAGIRAASSAELLEQSHGQGGASLAKVANGFFTGDLDDKFVPLWHAVRFLAAAGLPLLGGYILAFTAIDLVGELVASGVDQLIGPQFDKAALRVMPFYDLIHLVVVMGLRLALLGVTVARVGEVLTAGRAASRPRLGEAVTVLVVCVALALSSLGLRPVGDNWVVTGAIGSPFAVLDVQATVAQPTAARELVDSYGTTAPTDLVFLVVPITIAKERGSTSLYPSLRAGERRYRPWDYSAGLVTEAGFATRRDLVFEVDPADLAAGLVVELKPSGSLQLGSLVARVPLTAPGVVDRADYRSRPDRWVP